MTTMTSNEILIGGKTYGWDVLDGQEYRTIRLANEAGSVYDVVQGAQRTTCDCGDFVHRHATLDHSEGCKHIKALVTAGLIDNVRPTFTTPTDTVNLPEKYRPRMLSDLVGQEDIVFQLKEIVATPTPMALLFAGDTGTGKTSAAIAFARELGCSVDDYELGGLYSIESGNQTADNVRETLKSLGLAPMFGEIHHGGRWKVLVVNECDRMSEVVSNIWLDAIETLPARTVVIFSTNNLRKLPRRFRTRCEGFEFSSDADALKFSAQARVNEIWYAETGQTGAPRVEELEGAIEDGQLSFRACVQALVPLIRKARRTVQTFAPTPTVEVKNPPIGGFSKVDKWAHIDFNSFVAAYGQGEKFMSIVRRSGVPQSTLAKRMEQLGVVFPVRRQAVSV